MRYTVISRGDDASNHYQQQVFEALNKRQMVQDSTQPEIVISIGGDGTMLEAFHRYQDRLEDTAFIGIHTGHLGFYADWRPEDLDELIQHMEQKSLAAVEYPLLEVTIYRKAEQDNGGQSVAPERYLALNEATIKAIESSLVAEIIINGELFESFRGDGLCISTPSGSTAYNKSLGGAIVHPSLAAIQLTEMASINNRVYRTIGSPLILPGHHTCILKPMSNKPFYFTLDHLSLAADNIEHIELKVASQYVKFARYQPRPFWNRVRDAFITEE